MGTWPTYPTTYIDPCNQDMTLLIHERHVVRDAVITIVAERSNLLLHVGSAIRM